MLSVYICHVLAKGGRGQRIRKRMYVRLTYAVEEEEEQGSWGEEGRGEQGGDEGTAMTCRRERRPISGGRKESLLPFN